MEVLKGQRTGKRRAMTRRYNQFKEELTKTPLDLSSLEISVKIIEDYAMNLQKLDDEIFRMLIQSVPAAGDDPDKWSEAQEQLIDEELAKVEEYKDVFNRVAFIYNEKVRVKIPFENQPPSGPPSQSGHSRKSVYHFPKIQLKKFNGKLSEWLGWWSQFSKIHEDEEIHATDKFNYLSQSMTQGTRAKELIDSYPMTAENYPAAIKALKDRFGQHDVLIPFYIRGLLKLVIQNATLKKKAPLSSLFDKIETDIRGLGTLKVSTQEMGRFLHPIVEACLQEDTITAWQRSALYDKDGTKENPPKSKLDFLLEFLCEESKREMQRKQIKEDFAWDKAETTPSKPENKAKKVNEVKNEDIPTVAGLSSIAVQPAKEGCVFCGKNNHKSEICFAAKKMTMEERRAKVNEQRACYRCLRRNHIAKNCKVSLKCTACDRSHVDIMCSGPPKEKKLEVEGVTEELNQTKITSSNLGMQCQGDVLLKTLLVKVVNPISKEECTARILLDDASQRSYISKRLVFKLDCIPVGKEESRIVLMDGSMTDVEQVNQHEVIIKGLSHASMSRKLRVRQRNKIGCPIPKIPNGHWMEQLQKKNITLSDTQNETLTEIDMLIGSDYYEAIRTGNRCEVVPGLYAVETVFGWTVCGTLNRESEATKVIHSYFCGEVNKLWDLEMIGICDSAEKESKEEHDQQIKNKVEKSIKVKPDGRYVVKLPWVNGVPTIPTNYQLAVRRLQSATNKLNSTGMFDVYNKIFKEWLQDGIIDYVPSSLEKSRQYVPHRPVFKPDSITTPVRPVFDASARLGGYPSMNMLLETGPNMLEKIASLLVRFRRFPVAVIADIKKAFLNIEVDENDRNYQKFLWWDDDKKTIVEYWHCRVPFGYTCSPFLLAVVLDYHLRKQGTQTAEKLRKCLYVDNVVTSFPREDLYQRFKDESIVLLLKAQMLLRQWESNADTAMESEDTSVLGLKWNKKDDTLSVKNPSIVKEISVDEVTSRLVLSTVAQVFDPIGFVCPATLLPKLLLQNAWTKKRKWEEPWNDEDAKLFVKWVREMPHISEIRISRFAFRPKLPDTELKLQLHFFCDASQNAYATVGYCRIESKDGVNVQLLVAKSQVAPIPKKDKKITIPRLELLGCIIGARMCHAVLESLKEDDIDVLMWTDSSTCVAWIRRTEEWGVFVNNRVREILKLTQPDCWKHVPGESNPADLPSRGCTAKELSASSWWEGPAWLKLPRKDWPCSSSVENEDEIMLEKRKTVVANVTVEKFIPRYSHYLKNLRVAAWIRRFIDNCRENNNSRRRQHKFISIKELKKAERDLLYEVQQRSFGTRPEVKGFNVEQHDDGLWRLKTRLLYKDDTENFKFPILLPKDDLLTEQLVRYIHESSYHSGALHVIGRLRERYWIVHVRSIVKKVIKRCMRCQRYRADKMTCEQPPLPSKRVDTVSLFQTTGIDLAGPLYLKNGEKAWIVVYTCAVYRAVHLDLVDSLSTEAFLLSLERFINTVGRPHTIYTDNGTNFCGANNLMKKINWTKLYEKKGVNRIQWILNPPSSPWYGGWFERMVRIVKDLLKRMIGRAKLTYDEMRTCLAAVSQTINERPLTTITSDPEDLVPLSPSLFMKDLPVAFPEGENISNLFLQGSYRKLQQLKLALQARFRKEYLGFLTSRNLSEKHSSPAVGELVLVGDTNKKRFAWPLGRIVELIKGRDDKIRVAKVKTSSDVLTRPLQRLHKLEITEADASTIEKPATLQKVDLEEAEKPKEFDGNPEKLRDEKGENGEATNSVWKMDL